MRGNKKNQVGFLQERSRQVVAVSRQKCGLYIVGCTTFLHSASPKVWKVRDVCVMEVLRFVAYYVLVTVAPPAYCSQSLNCVEGSRVAVLKVQ